MSNTVKIERTTGNKIEYWHFSNHNGKPHLFAYWCGKQVNAQESRFEWMWREDGSSANNEGRVVPLPNEVIEEARSKITA